MKSFWLGLDDKRFWVGFTLVRGIEVMRWPALIDHLGDAASAWHSTLDELRSAG